MDEQSRIEELLSRTSDRPAEDFSRSWQMRKSPSCGLIFSGPTTGKRCVFAASSDVDSAWSKIKTAVEEDKLLFAKVPSSCLTPLCKCATETTPNSQEEDMTPRRVPDDFPREPDPGSVTGVQPKLLVREIDGRYQSGLSEEQLWVRYDACEDLASQLSAYASRKIASSGLSPDVALARAEKGVRLKVGTGEWDFSQCEVTWVMKRTRQLLIAATDG
jgi:hypothetical protein